MVGAVRRVGRMVCMLAVMAAGASAAGQVDAERVALMRDGLLTGDMSSQVRAGMLAEVLEARQTLIDEQPQHPDVLFWRTAQAEDALLTGLSLNGLELVVRYGLPGEEHQAALDEHIRTAMEQTDAIEAGLSAAIDSAPPSSSRRDRLVALRDSRLPMLRGMALTIAADRELVPDAEAARQEGMALLESAGPGLRGKNAVTAARQLALARMSMGEYKQAREMLEHLRRSETAGVIDQIGLRLGLNEVTARVDGPGQAAGRAQMIAATNSNPLERLLLIEQAARNWMALSRQFAADIGNPEAMANRDQAERNAVEAFLLLQPEHGGLEFRDPRMIDLLVEERLGRLGVADPAAPHLSESVLIAVAVPLVSSPETAMRARELLLPLADKSGLSPRVRSRALAMLVRAEVVTQMHASASEHAITWSRTATDRAEAHEAADLAVIHAFHAVAQSPDDVAMQELRGLAIENMLVHFDDHSKIDDWRLQAAGLAEQLGNEVEAMQLYESVGTDSPLRPAALSRQAMLVVHAAVESGNRSAAIAAARQKMAGLKRQLIQFRSRYPREERRAQVGMDLSEARLDLLDGRAIEALDQLTRPGMDSLDPALSRYVCMARINAAVMTGRQAAVDAVVDTLPVTVDVIVARDMLPDILETPGSPLPLDPLSDLAQGTAAIGLARVLEEGEILDVPLRMLIVEALRRSGRCDGALARVQMVLESNPDLGDALFSRAECLRLDPEADQAEVIGIYTRLSKKDPGQNPHRFWTAQLRLIQLMLADGRDPGAILARMNRLQRRYPGMGGPSYISEFAILRTQLVDQPSP